MANQTLEERVRELVNTVATTEIEALIHPPNAGSFDFEEVRDLIQVIKAFYGDVASAQLNQIPANFIEQFKNVTETQIRALMQLRDFNYKSGDPNQTSRGVISQLTNTWRDTYTTFSQHLAYARSSSAALAAQLESLRATASTAQKNCDVAIKTYADRAEALEKQLETRNSELEKVMTAAREAAKTAGVIAQAAEFDKEADRAQQASWRWFKGTGAAVVIGLLAVWYLFLYQSAADATPTVYRPNLIATNQSTTLSGARAPDSESKLITADLLQHTIARILIVTLLYSAVVWCARNYFAERHNYTVNRHRRNAMQTFQAFIAGSSDKATQDFILRQAAQCAFSPQQTGYLKDESLPTPGPASQIIDLVKPS